MSESLTAMRTGSRWVLRSALVLMVITTASMLALLTDLSLFRSSPLLYTLILAGIVTGSGLMIRNRYYLPLFRNLRFRGKLLLAPLALFVLTAPAAVIYLYYDLSGRASLQLLSGLFASFGAAFWISFMAVITLPAMGSALLLESRARRQTAAVTPGARQEEAPEDRQEEPPGARQEEATGDRQEEAPVSARNSLPPSRIWGPRAELPGGEMNGDPWQRAVIASALLALVIVVISILTDISLSGLVFFLPMASIVMLLLDVIIVEEFRRNLSVVMAEEPVRRESGLEKTPNQEPAEGFRNVILVADHYPDIIAGKLEYLVSHAGDVYASELTAMAARTFDPALIPALKVIASGSRFSEKIRQEATAGVTVIEKYYSDPVRHSDLLRLPGIPDRTAVARGIMLSRSGPQEQDVVKLLTDPNPEIRRTGLRAAGRYGLTGLKNDIVRAISNPETAREAFQTLRQFGPEVYGEVIGTAIKAGNSERVNIIILKLLDEMPPGEALPWLTGMVESGSMGIRQKAASSLCKRGWQPDDPGRQKIRETISETVHTVARLIALHSEARRSGSFLLAAALGNERKICTDFLSCLLSLLAGRKAAELMMPYPEISDSFRAGIASEAVETVTEDPAREPLRALLGNSTDADRLSELSLHFPVRSARDRSLSSFLLSSEQNITGIWTKACALHKAGLERKGLDREQAVSYLFSNSPVLQEESAAAIREINRTWYDEAESRLTEPSKTRISAVVNGTLPQTAMLFEKTRFLSLCFSNIPEEKLILLASGMRYSGSYDTTSLPGVLSWVVPSADGKTGIYSLPVSDIAGFVFYYSEYTDIFVQYMDNQGGLTVS